MYFHSFSANILPPLQAVVIISITASFLHLYFFPVMYVQVFFLMYFDIFFPITSKYCMISCDVFVLFHLHSAVVIVVFPLCSSIHMFIPICMVCYVCSIFIYNNRQQVFYLFFILIHLEPQ